MLPVMLEVKPAMCPIGCNAKSIQIAKSKTYLKKDACLPNNVNKKGENAGEERNIRQRLRVDRQLYLFVKVHFF